MRRIKCEIFVSCKYLWSIYLDYWHAFTQFSCFGAHHSALFIGGCWLKLEIK